MKAFDGARPWRNMEISPWEPIIGCLSRELRGGVFPCGESTLDIPEVKGTIQRARQLPTHVVGSLTPVSITEPVSGCVFLILYLVFIVAGWVSLAASGPKHCYSNNFQSDRYWLAGTGTPEVFELKFSYIRSSAGPWRPTPADVRRHQPDRARLAGSSGKVCAKPAGLARGGGPPDATAPDSGLCTND
ncbi:hypothetical protein B0H13DRAFT_2378618 [Mycena leptocephala]|nr:hypothetical protein B0H13DRAFT_2378618 [Mycena leptocephala]